MHNGIDLLCLPAPPKDMGKYAIKVLAVLFTKDELQNGIMHTSPWSKRVTLDPARVATMFGKSSSVLCWNLQLYIQYTGSMNEVLKCKILFDIL